MLDHGRKFFGLKPGAFIAILAAVITIATVAAVRHTFMGPEKKLGPAAEAKQRAADQRLRTLFERALLNPGNSAAHRDLAKALADAGRHRDATDEFKKAISLDPADREARMGLGLSLRELGLQDEAITSFREVLRKNPKDAEAIFQVGLSQLDEGEEALAAESFGSAIALNREYANRVAAVQQGGGSAFPAGSSPSVPEDAAGSGEEAGLAESEETAGDYAEDTPSGEGMDSLAIPQDAIDQFSESMVLQSGSASLQISLGTFFSSMGQYQPAIQSFSNALGIDPQSVAAHLGLGLAYLGAGNRQAAIAEYNTLTTLDAAAAAALLAEINK